MSPQRRHIDPHSADGPRNARPARWSGAASGGRLTSGEAVAYRVPRCRWPEAWGRLVDRKATFSTTRCDPWPGGHVDLLVDRGDAYCLGGLAQRLPAALDPWPPRRLPANARDWRALDDQPGDDELDRAFRALEKAARKQRPA